jgi:hypothetical protein
MIDPTDITNFDRTEAELQEFFLFTLVAAGKTAWVQAMKLEEFLRPAWVKGLTPFEYIEYLIGKGYLRAMICEAKLGQYDRLCNAFAHSRHLDLTHVTIKDLEMIPGIGPKTARFFILHTRPNQRIAVLDTHVLSWLREHYDNMSIPKTTPQSPSRYSLLENLFLELADKFNITPETLDLQIWKDRARQPQNLLT